MSKKPKAVLTPEAAAAMDGLAAEVLLDARTTLTVHLRFLDRALGQMLPVASRQSDGGAPEDFRFGTDGRRLYYDAFQVLWDYKEQPNMVAHKYLHSLLHNLFCHRYGCQDLDHKLWNLSCDMAVELQILNLDLPFAEVPVQERQRHELFLLEREDPRFGHMTADQIYRFWKGRELTDAQYALLKEVFSMDDHQLWYRRPDSEGSQTRDPGEEMEKVWRELSRRMQSELELMQKDRKGAGDLVQSLKELHRRRVDYKHFLKRFGQMAETMKVSEEEFDYLYYLYGLEHYGNMPLVEPLEYSEQKVLRDFVIAVDTSGSVGGPVLQSFLQLTFDLLNQDDTFFSRMNLFLIQCDDRVRDAVRISSVKDFEAYTDRLVIQGLGGTDFRPVFEYIAEQQKKEAMPPLQGLLYFTDGNGDYPMKRPPYPTAFVLSDPAFLNDVPPWAMRLTMTEEELEDVGT